MFLCTSTLETAAPGLHMDRRSRRIPAALPGLGPTAGGGVTMSNQSNIDEGQVGCPRGSHAAPGCPPRPCARTRSFAPRIHWQSSYPPCGTAKTVRAGISCGVPGLPRDNPLHLRGAIAAGSGQLHVDTATQGPRRGLLQLPDHRQRKPDGLVAACEKRARIWMTGFCGDTSTLCRAWVRAFRTSSAPQQLPPDAGDPLAAGLYTVSGIVNQSGVRGTAPT